MPPSPPQAIFFRRRLKNFSPAESIQIYITFVQNCKLGSAHFVRVPASGRNTYKRHVREGLSTDDGMAGSGHAVAILTSGLAG
jgi:hypothetical protein